MSTAIGAVIRLLLICLGAGLFMAFFGITPSRIITDTLATITEAWELIVGLARWAVPYILLGASVVIPVTAIVLLLRVARR